MKRNLLLLLCVFAMVAACLASCNEPEVPAHEHTVEHVEAKAATCTATGNVEYWYCTGCNDAWTDEAKTQKVDKASTVVAMVAHEYMFACDAHCKNCGELTNENAAHNIEYVAAKAATCSATGNIEYWHCTHCATAWADEARTQQTNMMSVTLPVLEHEYLYACDANCVKCGEPREGAAAHSLTHVEAVAPTCEAMGNIEYWYCSTCGTAWSDADLRYITNMMSVKLPQLEHEYENACDTDCKLCGNTTNPDAAHTIAHVEAKAPECHENGNIEYWACSDCGIFWSDEALTTEISAESVVIDNVGGVVVHFDAVDPTCHEAGNKEYWTCYLCHKVWLDKNLTVVSTMEEVIVPATADLLVHFDAVEPGCHYNGNIEYWVCYACELVWQDADLTQVTNIKNVILPAVGGGNVVHFDAVAPGCHYNGNIEHWVCYDCEQVWQDEALTQLTNIRNVVVPALGGEVVHFDAIAPGCHHNGQIEHWVCYECEQVWQNEELTQLTNIKNVVLPATGADVIHFEAVAPGCHYTGNIEYWTCYECEQVWQDAALTQLTNIKNVVLPAVGGEVVHFEAIEPSCHFDGQIEHWVCYECEQVWQDEALTQLTNIKNVILPATQGEVVHFEANAPMCHREGNIEYWVCYGCEQVWQDEALTQLTNIKNVVLPALGGEAIHFDAIAPSCHLNGQIEHWICYECEQVWQDEALTQLTNVKNVILPATVGEAVHFDAVAPGCHYNGNIEYWVCYSCEQVWQDEALTQLTNIKNVVLPAVGGEVVHFEAQAPDCHRDGHIEHWVCYECEQVWQNEELTQLTNIKNVILPALGGEVVHFDAVEPGCHYNGNIEYWVCYGCEQVWQDAELKQLTNIKNVVLPALGGEVVHFEAQAPDCHRDGHIEHWVCYECEQVWQDEALTQLTNIKNVVLPAVGGEVVHFDAVEPGCHYNGNIEYWVCYGCEQVWQDADLKQLTNIKNVVVPAVGGEVVHFEAIAPSCHLDGQIEHWVCYECEQVWQDEALTQLTNIKNVVLPAVGGEVVHFEGVVPSCHRDGNIEHWVCYECEQVWQNKELTQLTNIKNVILPAVGGEVVHFEAIEPACHYNGNIEHWVCYECEQVWQDEALTQLTNIKNVILPALGGEATHVEAVAPACHYNGNIEYWVCYDCEQVWQDADLKQLTNIRNVVVPALGGEVVHFEAIEPSCHRNGNIEHWVCYECEQVWQNEELTQLTNIKNVVLPAVGGEVVHFEAVEPACHYNGNIEYWVCYDCEQVWQNEELTQLTNIKNVVLPAVGGDVVHVEAVEPDCKTMGNIEHWYCEDCMQVWQDEALTQLTNMMNVKLGYGEHAFVEGVCTNCGEEEDAQ